LISSRRSPKSFFGIAAINVVNLLLDNGADVDTKDRDGKAALVMYYDIVVIADDTMEIVGDTLVIY